MLTTTSLGRTLAPAATCQFTMVTMSSLTVSRGTRISVDEFTHDLHHLADDRLGVGQALMLQRPCRGNRIGPGGEPPAGDAQVTVTLRHLRQHFAAHGHKSL